MRHSYFNIAVIGAGMFGCSAAKYLSKQEDNIALIGPDEPINKQAASSQLAFGAHYDQARITRRLGWDAVWAATDARSLNRFRAIEKESSIPFFHESGSLVLMAKTISSRTQSIIKHCQSNLIRVERMTSGAIEHCWPYFKVPQVVGGVEGLFEDQLAGYLNPRKLIAAQLLLFERAGGSILRGTVNHIIKDKSSNLWKLCIVRDGIIDKIYAKKILLAAGAFINHNQLLPEGCKLALYAFTEPNLLFEISQYDIEWLQKMPTIIVVDPEDVGNNNMSIYLLPPIQYPDNKWYIRIGPGMQPIVKQLDTLEQMRQWYIRQEITSEQREFLQKMLRNVIPHIKPMSIREACCIIEKTPTHYPYIGQINDDSSLQIVVGGNGHGARGSDEIGRLAANAVLGNAWDFPIEQACFKPILATNNQSKTLFECKPPFGLC